MEPVVDLSPPALTRWQWTWRLLSAALLSLVVWASQIGPEARTGAAWLLWSDLALGLSAFVAYLMHRRWPLGVAVYTVLLGAVSASASGPGIFAFISMATHRRWRDIIAVGALNIGCSVVFMWVSVGPHDNWIAGLVVSVLATGVATAVGLYVGARRELLATLRDRADRAEREQAMRVAQARTNERARIAREMHDVLAHRISLVAMHAGALAYRGDLGRDETRQAADVITQNAHQALVDLREILGVLRDPEPLEEGDRPQPTLADLPELVEDERRAGAHIRVATLVELADVPVSIGRNAFRMVQESLTNARKHAPDTTVDVILSGAPGSSLRVEVRNPLRVGTASNGFRPVPGAGLGLVGLAERAALSGGALEHGVTAGGEFVLQATLPWPA